MFLLDDKNSLTDRGSPYPRTVKNASTDLNGFLSFGDTQNRGESFFKKKKQQKEKKSERSHFISSKEAEVSMQ